MRVLRVYHGGRNAAHRARERALAALGLELTLVVPETWPERDAGPLAEAFRVAELPIERPGDVNRHAYRDVDAIRRLIHEVRPDVLDIHEEPVSVAARQWLGAAPAGLPVVMYTAQNVDKRFPPPFARYEREAYARVDAIYPCSRQAASVARGKGFAGRIDVLPLGFDPLLFRPGTQRLDADELVLGFFGRLVPEKGVHDSVRVLADVNADRPARLLLVGEGPEREPALELARRLRVRERVQDVGWARGDRLSALYRETHVVVVPSLPRPTGVEQFGRVVVEAQASGAVVAAYATGALHEAGGDAALLAEVGDHAALARAIADLEAGAYERRRSAGIEQSRSRTWARVAERQLALYRGVLDGPGPRRRLARSPRERRAAARVEFGPTAATVGGERPFALPLLRRGGVLSALLGRVLDRAAEAAAGVGRQRSSTVR